MTDNNNKEDPYAKIYFQNVEGNDEITSDKWSIAKMHPFYQCSLNLLGTKEEHRTMVTVDFTNNILNLKPAKETDKGAVPLEHSHNCPIRELDPNSPLTRKSIEPFVRLAVGIFVENEKNEVLITRRSSRLRTFASAWVIPGGHVDPGETLKQAAIRELKEETGIDVEPDHIDLFAIYESVFPVLLKHGDPTRHHIVLYFKCCVQSDKLKIRFSPEEVEAAAWISVSTARKALDETPSTGTFMGNELVITDGTVDPITMNFDKVKYEWKPKEFTIRQLQSIYVNDDLPAERLSTSSRFVLREWLKIKSNYIQLSLYIDQ